MNSEISSTSVAAMPASVHPLAGITVDHRLRQQDQLNSRDVVLAGPGELQVAQPEVPPACAAGGPEQRAA
jgi:hypothetical protein